MQIIASAPENLVKAILNKPNASYTKESPNSSLQIDMGAGFLKVGSRNNDFTSMAGFFRRKGYSPEDIYALISSINATLPKPLPDSEVQSIAGGMSRYKITPEDFTHHSYAKLLIDNFAGNVRYLKNIGFTVFDGKLWQMDMEELIVTHTALLLADEITSDIEGMKGGMEPKEYQKLRGAVNKLKSAGFIKSSLDLVKAHPSIHVDYSIFEKHPHLINFENGTFDLNAMTFREYQREDFLNTTLDLYYDPEADCPRFKEFLLETFEPEIASFVIRLLGYALLGSPIEQKLFVLYGHGQNGKSVLVEVISKLLGEYCVTIQPESLTGKMDGSIRNDLVKLLGTRIMFTSETRQGTVLDSALIKQITGQDKISARKLYKEFIEFTPKCVPFLVTNHLPVIDGADFAMARRMCLIPFARKVENPDRLLPAKLYAERAGIFNLLLSGLVAYKVEGLNVPVSIEESTVKYLNKSNLLRAFFEECLLPSQGAKTSAAQLYAVYRYWAANNGYKPLSVGSFKEMFERELGQEQRRSADGNFWLNVKLNPNR